MPKEQLAYPLEPTGDPAEVRLPSSPTQRGDYQGDFPQLKGEAEAQSQGGQPFANR